MDWVEEKARQMDRAVAVLRDKETIVARVYLSPDCKVLRIALPELRSFSQIKAHPQQGVIDFMRT